MLRMLGCALTMDSFRRSILTLIVYWHIDENYQVVGDEGGSYDFFTV